MSGESELRVVLRHVIPNSWGPMLENSSAIFGMAIIFCAGLGFLGVGIPLPEAEWGNMLSSGAPDAPSAAGGLPCSRLSPSLTPYGPPRRSPPRQAPFAAADLP